MSTVELTKEAPIPSVCKSQALSFCSVCLDAVVEGEDRSIARLKCGHHFHLDCIGSAFNAKGRMQCPNCRQVEQGRWLYANACCLHEDFYEDLTSEEDAEVYNAAAEWQVSHAPWCPHHQSPYGHISLAFEELDNFANGHLNPLQNAVHHVQVPGIGRGPIGPYPVGLRLGRPLNHIEDIFALQMNYVGHVSNHVGRGDVSHRLQSGSMLLTSNGSWTAYGGSSQNNTHSGSFGQPNAGHLSLGFLMGSPQFAQARYADPTGLFRSGQSHTRQARRGDAFQTSHRIRQTSPSERGQMSESVQGNGSFYSSGQSPNRAYHGDRMNWAAERRQREAVYSYGVPAYWWAWAPSGASMAMQNMAPSTYPYDGQFSSSSTAASRHRPSMEGFLEPSLEGPYMWVLH